MMNTLALDLQLLRGSDRQQPCIPDSELTFAPYLSAIHGTEADY
jgi:hypothetical protein